MVVEYWIIRIDRKTTIQALSRLIDMEHIICIPRMGDEDGRATAIPAYE